MNARVQSPWGSARLREGTVHVNWEDPAYVSKPARPNDLRFAPEAPRFAPDWHFYPARTDPTGTLTRPPWWFVRLPLWIPTLAFALPAAGFSAWKRFRREAWQCRACRYDLRGLAPGTPCPECGRPARPIARAAPGGASTPRTPAPGIGDISCKG